MQLKLSWRYGDAWEKEHWTFYTVLERYYLRKWEEAIFKNKSDGQRYSSGKYNLSTYGKNIVTTAVVMLSDMQAVVIVVAVVSE